MDRIDDGRRLKLMPIVDEHTCECMRPEVGWSMTDEDMITGVTFQSLHLG